MYGEVKWDIAEILKKLCEMKQIQLIGGKVCKDHVHMCVVIPPKFRQDCGNRHFWARDYHVVAVGNVNESTIVEYIKNQEENDKLEGGGK